MRRRFTFAKLKDFARSLCFLSPSFLGVCLFFIVPFAVVVKYAFTDVNGEFVQFQNFANLIKNPIFKMAAKNTLTFSAMAVPLSVILAIALALMLECGDMNAVIAPLTKIIEIPTMLAEDGFAFDTAELECVMRSYFCVGFRKEDTDLRDAVDGAISSLIRSGEVRAVAEKFALVPDDFGMAIAAELGFPMSPILG